MKKYKTAIDINNLKNLRKNSKLSKGSKRKKSNEENQFLNLGKYFSKNDKNNNYTKFRRKSTKNKSLVKNYSINLQNYSSFKVNTSSSPFILPFDSNTNNNVSNKSKMKASLNELDIFSKKEKENKNIKGIRKKGTFFIENLINQNNKEKELMQNTEALGDFFKSSLLNQLHHNTKNNSNSFNES